MEKYFVVLNNYLYGENRIEKMRKDFSYKETQLDEHHHLVFFELDKDGEKFLDNILPENIKLKPLGNMKEEGIEKVYKSRYTKDSIRKISKGYVVFSEKGKRLSKPYPTKEEAEKRLKQIEMFKHMNDSLSSGNTFIYHGKHYWSGAVNNLDGVIEEAHTYKEAKASDWHHSFYFSPEQVEDKLGNTTSFFYIDDEGNIYIDPMGRSYDDIDDVFLIQKIREQVKIPGYKEIEISGDELEEINDSVTNQMIPHYKIYAKGSLNPSTEYALWRTKKGAKYTFKKYAEWIPEPLAKKYISQKGKYEWVIDPDTKPTLLYDNLVFHSELNPILWTKEGVLKENAKEKIETITAKFKEWLENDAININVNDIIIIGSNASYTYTNKSDIDIHLIVDESEPLLLDVYNAYRALFNKTYDVEFKGVKVELFVQHDTSKLQSDGIYSLKQGWIKTPSNKPIPDEQVKNINEQVKEEFEAFKDQITKVLKSPTIEKIDQMIDSIYLLRNSIADEGEFSVNNQLFKEIRSSGYMDKLKKVKIELENNQLSIKDEETINMSKLNLPHLTALFEKLNAPYEDEFEGKITVEPSLYDFDYRVEGNSLKIYDKNEYYTAHYREDLFELKRNLYYEFGGKKPSYEETIDKIYPQIREALDKDGFKDEILEWDDRIVMTIQIPENLHSEVKDARSPELIYLASLIETYENEYEDKDTITFQFATESDAEDALKDVPANLDRIESDEESAYFVSFIREDVTPLIKDVSIKDK